ncbi:IS110 family transposase [Raoultibacter phocaeensis]|uniref:IS110 family transposase n=1 Tax=Raoultibacter phocaeensis TaxID=2479841 RepID=UPI00111A514B|nr:IS110 family transposase [Raoultibacter phocaeensis]
MIYAGIDIAKNEHVVGATDERGRDAAKPMPFANSTEGFGRCVAYLEGLAESKGDLLVGMEATGHYWLPLFCRLQDEGYAVAVVNPIRTDAMRRFKGSSRVKTDMIDCVLVAETLRCGDFEPSKLGDEAMIELRQLTRLHQELKESVADLKRQVVVALDQVFPEYGSIFSDTFGESSKAFLKRCPTPEECLGVRADSLAKTLERASRGNLGRDKADEIKGIARTSCGISVAASVFSFQIKLLIEQIDSIEGQIAEVGARVRSGIEAVEPLILTIPGIGHVLGARIVSEIGDIRRFRSAPAVVKYAGINPSVSQSGKFSSNENHITKQGSPYLRRALYLAAMAQLKLKTPFYDYYAEKRSEGKAHREALIAVSRKLVHVIYAVLSRQEPYDPEVARNPLASRSE